MVYKHDLSHISYLDQERREFVEHDIAPYINSKRLIKAFLEVPRELFVPKSFEVEAYLDIPLPIGFDQTISQPSLVAQMIELLDLKGDEKVLEIGTGSGYETAILSLLVKEVYSIEIIEKLYKKAKAILSKFVIKNVHLIWGDGTRGYEKEAPFDAIIVTAASRIMPQKLIGQLREGGKIVIPVGEEKSYQKLMVGTKQNGKLSVIIKGEVRFVPLVNS